MERIEDKEMRLVREQKIDRTSKRDEFTLQIRRLRDWNYRKPEIESMRVKPKFDIASPTMRESLGLTD